MGLKVTPTIGAHSGLPRGLDKKNKKIKIKREMKRDKLIKIHLKKGQLFQIDLIRKKKIE